MMPRAMGSADPARAAADLAAGLRLGFKEPGGEFRPVPIALTPWHLSHHEWYQARLAALRIGRLLDRVSRQTDWLLRTALIAGAAHSLPGELARRRVQQADAKRLARPASLIRHDLLLDAGGRWRWVESNVTAAGMGPFGERAGQLQRALQLHFGWHGRVPHNRASERQAAALVQAARGEHHSPRRIPRPLIVFAVAEQENNRHDQQLLADAIECRGGRVIRRTLTELVDSLRACGAQVCLPGEGRVDLIYFRTGYNLEDYAGPDMLDWRVRLEQFDVGLCPTVDLMLAGSKWTQQALSPMDFAGLSRLGFPAAEARQLQALMVAQYRLDTLEPATARRLIDRGWLLKSQREGGNSILHGDQAREALNHDDADGRILMAPIHSRPVTTPAPVLRGLDVTLEPKRIAELGVFTAGARAAYAGYLVRSKPTGCLEAGVHGGQGMLDSIAVQDRQSPDGLMQ